MNKEYFKEIMMIKLISNVIHKHNNTFSNKFMFKINVI